MKIVIRPLYDGEIFSLSGTLSIPGGVHANREAVTELLFTIISAAETEVLADDFNLSLLSYEISFEGR